MGQHHGIDIKATEVVDSFSRGINLVTDLYGANGYCPEKVEQDDNDNSDTHVAEISDGDESFFSLVYEGISSGVSTIYKSTKTVKDQFYSTISNVTSAYAEKMRQILKEEVFDSFLSGLTKFFDATTAPG